MCHDACHDLQEYAMLRYVEQAALLEEASSLLSTKAVTETGKGAVVIATFDMGYADNAPVLDKYEVNVFPVSKLFFRGQHVEDVPAQVDAQHLVAYLVERREQLMSPPPAASGRLRTEL